MTVSPAFLTSNSQLWMTPPKILKALSTEFNFTLDVCASVRSKRCKTWYNEDMDAFKKDWAKDAKWAAGIDQYMEQWPRVSAWCNPPYGEYKGKTVKDWIEKGRAEALMGLTTVFLLPCNKQDQPWWHDLVEPYAEVRPVQGRIHFLDPETGKRPVKWSEKRLKFVQDGNSQGSVLVIYGPAYRPIAPRKSFIVPIE